VGAILRLIRFKNLLVIILTQVLIKLFLITPYISNPSLSIINFNIYLLALVTIVSAGYIINDIYDIEIDKINRPKTRIISKEIDKESALKAYKILNSIGITSGFYVAYQIGKPSFGAIFIFFVFSLWKYSKDYKTSFLIGNLQVALLTALSIINIALFDLIPLGIKHETGSRIIFYIILIYAAFSFITTLIREIIKDLEDFDGDKKRNSLTLAISCGIEKTKKISILLILTPILGLAYFQYFQYSVLNSTFSIEINYWGVNLTAVFYILLLQLLFILLIMKLNTAISKSDFHFSSSLCKIIMLTGILSIPLFHLLYINQ